MKKILFTLVLSTLSAQVLAYKTCKDYPIGHVFSDGKHTFIGRSADSLDGIITSTKADYSTMVSIALAARASGKKIVVRYEDDSVNCSNPAWNAEITGIGF